MMIGTRLFVGRMLWGEWYTNGWHECVGVSMLLRRRNDTKACYLPPLPCIRMSIRSCLNAEDAAEWKKKLEELATRPKVVAIGECGLDYHSFNEVSISEEQRKTQQEGFLRSPGTCKTHWETDCYPCSLLTHMRTSMILFVDISRIFHLLSCIAIKAMLG